MLVNSDVLYSNTVSLNCVRTKFKQNVMITKCKPSQWLGAMPLHIG